MKILLVEDDRPSAIALLTTLTSHNYTVDLAPDGDIALDLATSYEYDLVLLDVVIPKLDGISLCRCLRQKQYSTPILLLTAKDSKADVVNGLDAGADDYIVKPYDLSELMARMRSLLRRSSIPVSSVLTWGDLSINPVSGEVTYKGNKIPLSPKEYSLLELFLRHPQRLFKRNTILDLLWTLEDVPSEKTITTHIKDLRIKLEAAGCDRDIIETVYGLGYRLKAPPDLQQEETDSFKAPDLTAIAKVLERFKDSFTEQIAVLEQAKNALLAENLTDEMRQTTEREAHKLAGSLEIFGYPKGSQLARAIEHLLVGNKILGKQEALQFEQLMDSLKTEMKKPPVAIA